MSAFELKVREEIRLFDEKSDAPDHFVGGTHASKLVGAEVRQPKTTFDRLTSSLFMKTFTGLTYQFDCTIVDACGMNPIFVQHELP